VLLGASACSVPAAGSSSGSSSDSGPAVELGSLDNGRLTTYNSGTFRFRYPASWTARNYHLVSSMAAVLVDVSNQVMHVPCTTTSSGTATTSRCTWPVKHLGPGGIWLEWTVAGNPSPYMPRPRGVPVTIGGRPSHQVVSRPGECRLIGGTETISVQIPVNNDNTYEIRVCLRGPNLARTIRQVQAIFDSVSFVSS